MSETPRILTAGEVAYLRMSRTTGLPHRGEQLCASHEALRARLAAVEAEREAFADELDGIRKLARVERMEDAFNAPAGECNTARLLRLYEAVAFLRVELATVKAQPGLVQKMCETAAANLIRAEQAEARLAQAREALEQIGDAETRRADGLAADVEALRNHTVVLDTTITNLHSVIRERNQEGRCPTCRHHTLDDKGDHWCALDISTAGRVPGLVTHLQPFGCSKHEGKETGDDE